MNAPFIHLFEEAFRARFGYDIRDISDDGFYVSFRFKVPDTDCFEFPFWISVHASESGWFVASANRRDVIQKLGISLDQGAFEEQAKKAFKLRYGESLKILSVTVAGEEVGLPIASVTAEWIGEGPFENAPFIPITKVDGKVLTFEVDSNNLKDLVGLA